ncbi:hypothetical protein OHT57_17250 [Streptomyces sp. NBC_00285]|uniref:hypothetical protein n=1 Tax=Streptomyces sp. NBC_00285 TaxID=2975700 RepID=UPI002E2CE527|nr:hypothetical protein [Streptomyces sp. NBC_00285]
MAATAVMIAALLCAATLYDTTRLITPHHARRPPFTRLRGRRAALEAEERWCTDLLLRGRIDRRSYQQRMSALARGNRATRPHRGGRSGRHCY